MFRNHYYMKKMNADKFPAQKRQEKKDFNVCVDKVSELYKGDINNGYLMGKLTGVFRDREINGQNFLQGIVAVPRDSHLSDNIDYIPVLLTREMYELNREKLINKDVIFHGTYQSKSLPEERLQFFKPIKLDFDVNDGKYIKRNNSIHLGGTILKKPFTRQYDFSEVVKTVISVNQPTQNNIIPVYMRTSKKHGQMLRDTVDVGDRIELFGRAQSFEFKVPRMKVEFTNIISIGYLGSIVYKKDDEENKIFVETQEEF